MEKRFQARDVTAKERKLVGYAARFGQPTRIGDFTEVIERGAFKRSLDAGADVLALVDHDATRLLGRTASKSLRLWEDEHGLAFELALPQTTLANDLLALTERGDINGMSFGFRVRPGGETWSADRTHRTLRDVELVEISVAQSFAAYQSTSVQARSQAHLSDDPWTLRVRLMEMEAGQ